jgi:hypothetical protein
MIGPPLAQLRFPGQAAPLPQRQVKVASHHSPELQQTDPQQGPGPQRLQDETHVSPDGGPARSIPFKSVREEDARSDACERSRAPPSLPPPGGKPSDAQATSHNTKIARMG